MGSTDVDKCYISCSCNRTPHCADWNENGLIAFGSCHGVAVSSPQGPTHVVTVLVGHTDRVNCVKWIKPLNGGASCELVSASTDKTVIVWSYNEEKAVSVLKGHSGAVTVVEAVNKVDSDGSLTTLIVSASTDSSIRSWYRKDNIGDFLSGQMINLGSGFALDLSLIVLPQTSAVLLSWGGDDQKIHLCLEDNQQLKEVHRLSGHEDWIRGIDSCVNDSGEVLLASSSQDLYIRVWRISHQAVSSLVTSQQELRIEKEKFSFQKEGAERVYTVELESVLQGHDNWIYSVKWQPAYMTDGVSHQPMRLLSASMDKTLVIWSPDEKSGVWIEQVHVGEVGGNNLGFYGGLFSPDGNSIMAHGYQGAFNIWHHDKETEVWQPGVVVGGHFDSVNDIMWDREGAFLISVSTDQTTRLHALWRAPDEKEVSWHEISRPQVHGYDMQCICPITRFSFASGADEKVIRVFEAPQQFLENLSKLCQLELSALAPAKRTLAEGASVPALGLSNKAVFQDDTKAKESEREEMWTTGHDQYPDVYFTPVLMDKPPTEENLLQNTLWPESQKLYGHGYEIFALACNRQRTVLASACKATKVDHAAIILWDTSSWQQLCSLPAHSLTVTQLAFSPSGDYLLSVSRDRTWSLFEKGSQGECYKQVAYTDKKTAIHSRIIWSCDWSHDSLYFVTVSRDKKAVVWGKRKEVSDTCGCLGNYTNIGAPLELQEPFTAVALAPVLVRNSYIIALGTDSGQIYIYSWRCEVDSNWTRITHLSQRFAHHLTVKRLRFRPKPGALDATSYQNEETQLQLASCGADHIVRIQNIHFADSGQ